jgi:hypothetical protein
MTPSQATHLVTLVLIVAIGAAYFVFLWASWQDFQKRNDAARGKIDELLERLPKPATSE